MALFAEVEAVAAGLRVSAVVLYAVMLCASGLRPCFPIDWPGFVDEVAIGVFEGEELGAVVPADEIVVVVVLCCIVVLFFSKLVALGS